MDADLIKSKKSSPSAGGPPSPSAAGPRRPFGKLGSRLMTSPRRSRAAWLAAIVVFLWCPWLPACTRTDASPDRHAASQEEETDLPLPANARVQRDPRKDTIRLLKGNDLSADLDDAAFESAARSGAFDRLAIAFVAAHRSAFRLEDPARELHPKTVNSDDLGMTHVKLRQTFHEIPILGAELVVHFRGTRSVYLVNGNYVPTPAGLETTPLISSDDARLAVAAELGISKGTCETCTPQLVILPLEKSSPRLAWLVPPNPTATTGWEFVIDARDGTNLRKLPTVYRTGKRHED